MSVDEIRQLDMLLGRALEVFRAYEVDQLSAHETRARMSIAAARRQLDEELGARNGRKGQG